MKIQRTYDEKDRRVPHNGAYHLVWWKDRLEDPAGQKWFRDIPVAIEFGSSLIEDGKAALDEGVEIFHCDHRRDETYGVISYHPRSRRWSYMDMDG